MKIVSVNVGMPREVVWKGMTVWTGIFKEPEDGPVMISELNLAGDRQANLTVHGGHRRRSTHIPPSTTSIGEMSCRRRRSRGACSVRTSQPRGSGKTRFASVILSGSVLPF